METAARYTYQVYKTGSFTKAAKVLYVSQPALSAVISRLEDDLGFRIFDRSTIPCSLTAEGRIYIESVEEIIESENNMLKRIRDISDVDHGSITVGGSSFASYLILSDICKEFYKAYPKIRVTLDIGNSGSHSVLYEKLENNEIDCLISYEPPHSKYATEVLLEERLIIAMHKNLPGADKIRHLSLTQEEILTKQYSSEREIEDMSIFQNIKFIEFARRSETERRMLKLLGSYKSAHYKIQNSRHSEMHYNLMCAGIGAVLTTSLGIMQKPIDKDILFFIPKSEDSYRKIFLIYNRSSHDKNLIKNFIMVAKNIYSAK